MSISPESHASPEPPRGDTDDLEFEARANRVLSLGQSMPVGGFHLDLATGRWMWSDEIYVMHGFEPGQIVPSTDLLLAHKHPEDRQHVSDILTKAQRDGAPFSSVHRIIDAHGQTRVLGITGHGRRGPSGRLTEVVGYFIDLTGSYRDAVDREATASIKAASASRASIEQAKGILMATMNLTDDEAFALLRQRSNDTNIPLRDVASALVDDLRGCMGSLTAAVEAHLGTPAQSSATRQA